MKWQAGLQLIVTIFNGIELQKDHFGLIYVVMEYCIPLVLLLTEAFHKIYFREQHTKWELEHIMFMDGQFGHPNWQ